MADLNTQFPGLETLFQNLPAAGYFQSGQMQAIAQDNNARQQQAFDAEQAQMAKERPLNLDTLFQQNRGKTIANDASALDLSNKQANNGLQLQFDQEKLRSGISAQHLDQMAQKGQMYSNFGAQLSQIPAAARGAYAAQWMQQNGVDDPNAQKLIQSNDPRLGDYFAGVGKNMYEIQDKTRLELQKNKETNDTHLKTAQIGADATLGAARIGADSRLAVANSRTANKAGAADFESSLMKVKSATQKMAALLDNAKRLQEDNPDLAESYRARARDLEPIARQELAAGGAQQTSISPTGGLVTSTRGDSVGPLMPQSQAAPAAVKDPMKILPQGSKDNGDGTFTLPSGKVVRPKQG